MTHRDDLRTSVMWTSTARLQQSVTRLERSHAKVCNLDVLLRVQQQVFRLEVAVADIKAMTVIDSSDNLLKVARRLVGGEATLRDEVVEQLAAFHVFENQIPAYQHCLKD